VPDHFFKGKQLTNKFLRGWAITMVLSVGVDYLIATKIAGSKDGVWEWFAILMIVPLAFALKWALIRVILWNILGKKELVVTYVKMFSASHWSKPSSEYQDAEDYLIENLDRQENSLETRFKAAKMYGYLRAVYETQQIVGALQMSSAIKAAMIIYEKNYKVADS
jgi:hypothetical protein